MTGPLSRIFHLGVKELLVLGRDITLLLFIGYGFTIDIKNAAEGMSLELRNAAIAIVDEDQSPLSKRIAMAFRSPHFHTPDLIYYRDIDRVLDRGTYSFVLVIPENFQSDFTARRLPELQLNVDATAVNQAYIGAGYIRDIVAEEIVRQEKYRTEDVASNVPIDVRVRVLYNQNLTSEWYNALIRLLLVVTQIAFLLPAAALLREKEHGTIEHLLVMPLGAGEIMLAKVWPTSLVVMVAAALALYGVVMGFFGVPFRGSELLFFCGTFIYLFAITAIGILLATFTRSIQQLSLLAMLVLVPLMFLSGTYTPVESMPDSIRWLTAISPVRYYVEFATSIVFRGAGLDVLWPKLAALTGIGAVLFAGSMLRFRIHFGAAR
jgi:ABC-2 type transport system permease protein